jgi:hypothetical protein
MAIRYYSLSKGQQKTAVTAAASAQGGTVEVAVDAAGMDRAELVRLMTDTTQFINEDYWPSAPGTLWTPAALGSDLIAWWNADDLADGAVAAWADRVAAITPVQATEASKPVKAAASFNGVAGGTFDGADQLTLAATTGLPTGATPCEIWLIVMATATGVAFSYGGGSANWRRVQRVSGPAVSIGDGTSSAVVGSAGSWPTNRVTIIGARFDAALLTLRVNGAELASGAVTLATETTRLRIGANTSTSPGSMLPMTLRHGLVTGLMSVADQLRMEGWLAHEARSPGTLVAGHPYANYPPGT